MNLDDGITKFFFNTKADVSNAPTSVRNMITYIERGIVNDMATKKVEEAVEKARENEEWRREYMMTVFHDRDIRNEGREEGRKITQANDIKKVMRQFHVSEEQAFDVLEIPNEEREEIKKYVNC